MALFRRNKTDDSASVPEEVTSYYQAEKRDRAWMAWLLALLSLAVTALVVMGLFFGGRWVYRKLRPNSGSNAPIAANNTSEEESSTKKDDKKEETNKPANNPTTGTAPNNGNVNAPTNPTPAPATTTAPATAPATPNNSDLPNTGPGDVVAVFVLCTLAGAVVHRYVLRSANE